MAAIVLVPLFNAAGVSLLGGALGASLAGAIGGAVGSVAASFVNGLFTAPTHTEGPRLKAQSITGGSEGAPMNLLYGASRMSGNIIWATRFEEEPTDRETGGKGGPKNINTEYTYFMNFAIAFCEGEVSHIGRIWAGGKLVDQGKYGIRIYLGTETQMPDELIVAKEGAARSSAYRGTCYIVFERLPVAEFGSQPQITAEVFRSVGTLEPKITAVAFNPDAGEFGLDTIEQTQNIDGEALPENRHVMTAPTDFLASMDELQALAPNVANATLHPQWFADDLRCGRAKIRPAVRDRNNAVAWACHTEGRSTAAHVTHLFGLPLFGGTSDDTALARAALDMQGRGVGVTISPQLTVDVPPEKGWQYYAGMTSDIIAYSDVLKVAVGLRGDGQAVVSRDLLSWTAHTVPTRSFTSVCWSTPAELFVAVADDASGGTIFTSVDGLSWIQQSAVAGQWQEVVWADDVGLFVVVGMSAPHAMWSTDGISWVAGSAPANSWSFLAYAPALEKFVALGSGADRHMMESLDGKKWIEHATTITGSISSAWQGAVTWSEDIGMFAATASQIASAKLCTSADGINWAVNLDLGATFTKTVAAGAGGLLAVTSSGDKILHSVDGVSWATVSSGEFGLSAISVVWVEALARFVTGTIGGMVVSNVAYKPSISRLSCDPAWGQIGTPDAGGNAVELAAQIAAFFGGAQANDIALTIGVDDATIAASYSGPAEWSYRRFILHYAHLTAQLNIKQPGTVTTFIIGSGMSGMTRLRASNSPEMQADYIVTEALISLMTEVRSVVGAGVEISYAADIDEYGALPLSGGRVGFPLDALWGHGDCGFVGLNAQFPLTDWRDGVDHLDAQAGITTIYDPAYLASGVGGGELYDWTYADQAARDAQTRTPITDAVLNKPWIWRKKDLEGWWGNSHYARTAANIEHASATPWGAQSKPIRFVALMCPAVDKASNEPSARYDPVALADHKRVWHSSGARDDAIQRATLEAVIDYWADPANNPSATGYVGTMVDTAATTIGWYDARPHSTFPLDGRYWSDADNHEYGPWITGRLGVADAAGTIRQICADFGFAKHEIGGLGAVVTGITAQAGNSPRSILESLQPAMLFDVVEGAENIRFQRRGGAQIAVTADQLVRGDGEPWQITRAQETELPQAVELSYGEVSTDDQPGMVRATWGDTAIDRIQTFSLPVVMPSARAQALADIALNEIWTAREAAELSLPPSMMRVEAGDVLVVEGMHGQWRVASITDGSVRQARVARFDGAIYTTGRYERRSKFPVGTSPEGAHGSALATPLPLFLDLPLLKDDHDPDAGYFAAYMRPIRMGIAAYRSPSTTNFTLDRVLSLPAITGVTTAALPAGPLWTWDMASVLEVELKHGKLESLDDLSVTSGHNAIALEQPSGEWEIVQFANAELIRTRRYRLTRLLRGQRGSEHAVGAPLAAGARFVLLDAGVVQTTLTAASVGQPLTWRVGPADALVGDKVFGEHTFTYTAKARRPYSPVHLAAKGNGGDVDLSWRRRSRLGYGAFNRPTTPLGEDAEAYEIDILDGATVVRTLTSSTPAITYSAADQTADFGGPQASLTFNVYQISGQYGRGIAGTYSGAIS